MNRAALTGSSEPHGIRASPGIGDGPGAEGGIDAAAAAAHDAQAMNEPAALTSPAAAGLLVLPPVTDVFRDDELDLLETRVAGAEIAVRAARYDDAVEILDGLTVFPAQYPNLALRALLAE